MADLTMKDHVALAEMMAKALNSPSRGHAPGKPVRRPRRRSVSQALQAAKRAGIPITRIELDGDKAALIAGESQAADAVNDLDAELEAFEARHNGQDTA